MPILNQVPNWEMQAAVEVSPNFLKKRPFVIFKVWSLHTRVTWSMVWTNSPTDELTLLHCFFSTIELISVSDAEICTDICCLFSYKTEFSSSMTSSQLLWSSKGRWCSEEQEHLQQELVLTGTWIRFMRWQAQLFTTEPFRYPGISLVSLDWSPGLVEPSISY